ncbi:hypothetical protein PHLCEN_2v8023 [Hermanssonia centrifuga]|uniref:Uncharacterized protein n=1 Tax=Hermanssonia centrifuga TaxID=98765 RepID=A0A2R6NUW1_9APHY|nr:hypothetical protein PHLCEN_2v8023 [Hermanssonia centrifuga]
MADGASAIIGIVAFGLHVVHRVIEIVEEIRDAPGDILALQDDAVEVGYLLRQLQQSGVLDTVVIPPGRATRASVDRLKGALEEIKLFVEAVSEERQDGALRVRKIKLFLKPGRCQKLRGNLTSLKSFIIAIVTASTSCVTSSVTSPFAD